MVILPVDLVLPILSNFVEETDTPTLLTISVVSKLFYRETKVVLYSRILIVNWYSLQLFTRSVRDNPGLEPFVRELSLFLSFPAASKSTHKRRWNEIAFLVRSLQRLRRLEICPQAPLKLSDHTFPTLHTKGEIRAKALGVTSRWVSKDNHLVLKGCTHELEAFASGFSVTPDLVRFLEERPGIKEWVSLADELPTGVVCKDLLPALKCVGGPPSIVSFVEQSNEARKVNVLRSGEEGHEFYAVMCEAIYGGSPLSDFQRAYAEEMYSHMDLTFVPARAETAATHSGLLDRIYINDGLWQETEADVRTATLPLAICMDNLTSIAGSLPGANPAHLANAEADLLNNFKAAALSIATLYRSSRQTSKRAYNAGYGQACQDLLLMIQQGVSVGGISPSPEGMTVGRVMDWIEARLEAIKSREEEEDEDNERDKSRERARSASKPTTNASASTSSQSQQTAPKPPPTPLSPVPARQASPTPPRRTSTPHPFAPSVLGTSSVPLAQQQQPEHHHPIAAGAKRRHAVMMMLDSSATSVSIEPGHAASDQNNSSAACSPPPVAGGSGRRRIRSSRASTSQAAASRATVQAQSQGEAMEVEEDGGGRERKRVARR